MFNIKNILITNPKKYFRNIESISYNKQIYITIYYIFSMLITFLSYNNSLINAKLIMVTIFSIFIYRIKFEFDISAINVLVEIISDNIVYKEQIRLVLLPVAVLKNFVLIFLLILVKLLNYNIIISTIFSYLIYSVYIFYMLKYKFKIKLSSNIKISTLFFIGALCFSMLTEFGLLSRVN